MFKFSRLLKFKSGLVKRYSREHVTRIQEYSALDMHFHKMLRNYICIIYVYICSNYREIKLFRNNIVISAQFLCTFKCSKIRIAFRSGKIHFDYDINAI